MAEEGNKDSAATMKNGGTNEDDFDVIEEGSEEAKKLEEEQRITKEQTEGGEEEADEGEESDARLTDRRGAHEDTERPLSKSKRNRLRAKEKLEQKESIIRSLSQQNRTLSERLNSLEQRQGSSEIAMLDKAINDTRAAVEMAEQRHSEALMSNDPRLVTDAMKGLYATQRQLETLETTRANYAQAVRKPQGAVDPNISRNVNAWMARNSWFRPGGTDNDSRIAKTLDDAVAAEGYDPATEEYWNELDRRIKKHLPERVRHARQEDDTLDDDEADENPPAKNRGGKQEEGGRSHVRGSSAGGQAGGKRVRVVLSKERVQALKDAGIWDDVERRNKMIRQYQEYDRNATA